MQLSVTSNLLGPCLCTISSPFLLFTFLIIWPRPHDAYAKHALVNTINLLSSKTGNSQTWWSPVTCLTVFTLRPCWRGSVSTVYQSTETGLSTLHWKVTTFLWIILCPTVYDNFISLQQLCLLLYILTPQILLIAPSVLLLTLQRK
jgi:hypothetical protein